MMSLIAKAQALQHKRMEALRRYVEDIDEIDRRRHELDLASSRAWLKVTRAGWARTDLARLGLSAPKKPRARRSASSKRADPVETDSPDGEVVSDG